MIAIATLLSAGGFVGFLWGSGKLNTERVEAIAAVLRGQSGADADAVEADGSDVAASQPAAVRSPSAEEARQARRARERQAATLERAERDLAAQRTLLDQVIQNEIELRESFDRQKSAWIAQKEKLTEGLNEEGFKLEVKYASMLPDLAKDHVISMWKKGQVADVVRLFRALDASKGRKILSEFKTAEEKQIFHQLMEKLRLPDVDGFVPGSGKSPGRPAP